MIYNYIINLAIINHNAIMLIRVTNYRNEEAPSKLYQNKPHYTINI